MNHVCGYYRSYIWSKTHVSMISNTYVIPQGLLSLREAQCGLWSLRSSSLLNSITRILRNLWFKYLEVIVLAIILLVSVCSQLLANVANIEWVHCGHEHHILSLKNIAAVIQNVMFLAAILDSSKKFHSLTVWPPHKVTPRKILLAQAPCSRLSGSTRSD